ncbi:MAG: hypothetical protein ABSB82_10650 [Terriglobia bacterium]
MGEVYSARDAKLGHEATRRILHEAFANDPERMAQFQPEPRAVAQASWVVVNTERGKGIEPA